MDASVDAGGDDRLVVPVVQLTRVVRLTRVVLLVSTAMLVRGGSAERRRQRWAPAANSSVR
ncbi:hypothetical protein [Streptacidiphilus rugosus]|uniref:hypothetical protein n=1 Tax=Streptacidiphilus rugosus TaxID=405783 RepID=UPI0005635924|nr:hypothetical protein [Streptacidiphilus rugosus]